jgi:hypothetical protein
MPSGAVPSDCECAKQTEQRKRSWFWNDNECGNITHSERDKLWHRPVQIRSPDVGPRRRSKLRVVELVAKYLQILDAA